MQLRYQGFCSNSITANQPQSKLFIRQLPQQQARTRQHLQTTCSIKARWCIDIKYGVKMEAIALLQEWVQAIGSKAGLNAANSSILSGAVGVPESRLELEVTMESFSELESFWQQIPQQEHKAWSQRAQHFLIDGSPQWDIYRTVAIPLDQTESLQPSTSVPEPATDRIQSASDRGIQEATSLGILLESNAPSTDTEQSANEVDLQDNNVMLDWKGEPMKINPGDKLPFNFN